MVHGDDSVTAGKPDQLEWLETRLKNTYDIKTLKLLPNNDGGALCNVLNRVLRWNQQGWQLEGDPRRAELIAEQLQLQDAKPLSTPCGEENDKDDEKDVRSPGTVFLVVRDLLGYIPVNAGLGRRA